MLSLNPKPHFKCSFYPINSPQSNPTKMVQNYPKLATAHFLICKKGANFGSFELKRGENKETWMCSRCMSEGDRELEEKILEYMEKSEKPKRFPTKKELMNAGRFDLVEEIKKRGGWFSLGFEDVENDGGKVEESEIVGLGFDLEEFKRRQDCCGGNDSSVNKAVSELYPEEEAVRGLPSPSSSGRSLEITNEEESGVEGILSRLQRERNSSLGIDIGTYGRGPQTSSMDEGAHFNFQTSTSTDRIGPGKNGNVMSGGTKKGALNDTNNYHNHYTKPDPWKVWSIQQAGSRITEFEAAEISYEHVEDETAPSNSDHVSASKYLSGLKEINEDKITTRLKQLESELSSALNSLRFAKEGSIINKVSSSSELEKLYDECEFQENEVMHAKEKLRAIRAKLAVIEGKRSLLISEATNTEMLNQRRLEGARKALQLLRTTMIVWHNSASEVLLVGSYDGWTSQRKMRKSSSRIFCASLRLYPGRYEIKFIVDGIWRVDPLLPIVHNNGYENNLIIIT